MVKKREVDKWLKARGFQNVGGAKHDKYVHPDGRFTEIPRHGDVKDFLFRRIKKDLGEN